MATYQEVTTLNSIMDISIIDSSSVDVSILFGGIKRSDGLIVGNLNNRTLEIYLENILNAYVTKNWVNCVLTTKDTTNTAYNILIIPTGYNSLFIAMNVYLKYNNNKTSNYFLIVNYGSICIYNSTNSTITTTRDAYYVIGYPPALAVFYIPANMSLGYHSTTYVKCERASKWLIGKSSNIWYNVGMNTKTSITIPTRTKNINYFTNNSLFQSNILYLFLAYSDGAYLILQTPPSISFYPFPLNGISSYATAVDIIPKNNTDTVVIHILPI